MSTEKKIQASDVVVGNRTLDGVLTDLAEQVKANDARCTESRLKLEAVLADCRERSARAEEMSARAEEMSAIALRTIAALTGDLRATTQEMREANAKTSLRLSTLEGAGAI